MDKSTDMQMQGHSTYHTSIASHSKNHKLNNLALNKLRKTTAKVSKSCTLHQPQTEIHHYRRTWYSKTTAKTEYRNVWCRWFSTTQKSTRI